MTNLLAIEISQKTCSVALMRGTDKYDVSEFAERQQSRQILLQVHQVLQEANMALTALNAIAFSCGPGSFTGIRLAASVVQGLAFGAKLPVIPVSSLQALAQGAYVDLNTPNVAVAIDAYGGNIYWGVYQLGQGGIMEAVFPESHCLPEGVLLPEMKVEWIGVGDGWEIYQDAFAKSCSNCTIYTGRYPRAKDVLVLAHDAFMQGKYLTADQALPIYLYGEDHWRK